MPPTIARMFGRYSHAASPRFGLAVNANPRFDSRAAAVMSGDHCPREMAMRNGAPMKIGRRCGPFLRSAQARTADDRPRNSPPEIGQRKPRERGDEQQGREW